MPETDPISLEYRYDRRAVLRTMVVFQIALLILCYWTFMIKAGHTGGKPKIIGDLIIAGGFALYGFVMATLVKSMRYPRLVWLTRSGCISYHPYLRVRTTRLSAGDKVEFDDERLLIRSSLVDVVGAKSRDGTARIPLPARGLVSVGSGTISIEGET